MSAQIGSMIMSVSNAVKYGEIGKSQYEEIIRGLTNRNVGFSRLFAINTPTRDAVLISNPLYRRYLNHENALGDVSAPLIGEAYDVYENINGKRHFLDELGGLSGYYWSEGYKKKLVAEYHSYTVANSLAIERVSKSLDKVTGEFELNGKVYQGPIVRSNNPYGIEPRHNEENYVELYSVGDDYVPSNVNKAKAGEGSAIENVKNHINNVYGYSGESIEINNEFIDGSKFYRSSIDSYKYKYGNSYGDKLSKIRGFLNYKSSFITHKDFQDKYSDFRPNSGATRFDKFSVLKNNGLVQIAPTNENNDIKKCMFSIENLAWKDILKKDTLSDEQIGPNGGRIMWFPPYNIKFTENMNVNWNQSEFIGRGEKVYTYTNSERSGTLDFTILVDHPSIFDMYSYYNKQLTVVNTKELLDHIYGVKKLDLSEKPNVEVNINNNVNPEHETKPDNLNTEEKTFFVFLPNLCSGKDEKEIDEVYESIDYENSFEAKYPILYSAGTYNNWYYHIDNEYLNNKLDNVRGGIYDYDNRFDGYFYESAHEIVKRVDLGDGVYGLNTSVNEIDKHGILLLNDIIDILGIDTDEMEKNNVGLYKDLKYFLENYKGKIENVKIYATASNDNNVNDALIKSRGETCKKYLINKGINTDKIKIEEGYNIKVPEGKEGDINCLEAKLARSVKIVFTLNPNVNDTPNVNSSTSGGSIETRTQNNENNKTENNQDSSTLSTTDTIDKNLLTYDNEYLYFKEINDDINKQEIKDSILEKIQYFTPAFHSITPEGFNARLTFLHQCTRQGPTISRSDDTKNMAGNLSFGRPPVCVLRVGDFFNTKIMIESMSFSYDDNGVQWDMNPEGIGLQPMLCNVNMTFKILGGSDLSGPIEKLQNAVSYNYYANTSVYDKRSDYRNEYITEKKSSDDWKDTLLVEWNGIKLENNK